MASHSIRLFLIQLVAASSLGLIVTARSHDAALTSSDELEKITESCATYGGQQSESWRKMVREAGRTALRLPLDAAAPRETASPPDTSPGDTSYLPFEKVAVIVEPRDHPCTGIVVRSVLRYLGDGWGLQVFHGPDNVDQIVDALTLDCSGPKGSDCFRNESALKRVRLTNVAAIYANLRSRADVVTSGALEPVAGGGGATTDEVSRWPDWLKQAWPDIAAKMDSANDDRPGEAWGLTREAYSQVLLSSEFWGAVAGESVLVFQTDAFLCREGVDDFLGYDYLGAPWKLCPAYDENKRYICTGGNGGLSLRKRSTMLKLIGNGRRSLIMEDFQFADWLFRTGTSKVGVVELLPFSDSRDVFVETLMPNSPDEVVPLGVHKAYAYLSEPDLSVLLDRCMVDLRTTSSSVDGTSVKDEF